MTEATQRLVENQLQGVAMDGPPAKRQRFSFTDLELEVADGEIIQVHSYVLMSASEVFAKMLQSEMKESQTGRILLKHKTRAQIEEVLKHLDPRGAAPPEVTEQNVAELLQFADEFQVTGLRNRCVSCLEAWAKTSPGEVLLLSSEHNITELTRSCTLQVLEEMAQEGSDAVKTGSMFGALLRSEDDATARTTLYHRFLQTMRELSGCSGSLPTFQTSTCSRHWWVFVSTVFQMERFLKTKQPRNQTSVVLTETFLLLLRLAMEGFEVARNKEASELRLARTDGSKDCQDKSAPVVIQD